MASKTYEWHSTLIQTLSKSRWALLNKNFKCQSISKIDTYSKLIIDWAVGKHDLHVNLLYHWCHRINALKNRLKKVTFQHTFCEHNRIVDLLSKKGLGRTEGLLFVIESKEVLSLYKFSDYGPGSLPNKVSNVLSTCTSKKTTRVSISKQVEKLLFYIIWWREFGYSFHFYERIIINSLHLKDWVIY